MNVIEDEDGGAGELSVVKLKEAEKREGENINRTSPIQSGPPLALISGVIEFYPKCRIESPKKRKFV